jgi:predicted nucleic acid-binding protein
MPVDAGRTFFDTNVLLYLVSRDVAKSRRLDDHLLRGGMISVQVLNEFVNVCRRKYGLDLAGLRPFLSALRETLDVMPISLAVHDRGLGIIERYRLSTYDAMIVAAAIHGNCATLLSEDMQHEMRFEGGLQVINPFRP